MADEVPLPYLLNRSGTTTPLSVDLSQPVQTLADGTELSGVQRIHFLGGEGADTVLGGAFSDTLSGAGGADLLSGGGGDDVLIGAAGDTLLGGEGQDQFTISSAPAQIQGGAGMDVLTITGAAAFTAGSLSEVEQIFVNRGLKVDFSKLSVGQNVASGAGTAGGVYLIGSTGADSLVGGAGADTLEGGSGSDILQGGEGNDRLSGGSGNDSLYGGAGDDVLETKRSTGPDYFDGGDGIDRVVADFLTSSANMRLDLTHTDVLQALGGGSFMINVERVDLTTGSGADVLIGGALADTLNGGAGDDILAGASGDDRLTGGSGIDIAQFSGLRAQYGAVVSGANVSLIDHVTSRDGSDLVSETELFQFVDGTFTLAQLLRPEVTDVSLSNASLEETAVAGAVVGLLGASVQDAGPGPAITYSLGAEETRFALQGGQLVLAQALTPGVYHVLVQATDSRGAQRQEVFDITIIDVDQPPTQLTIANLTSVAENTAVETRLADVSLSDPDIDPANRVYTFSVDDPRFEVRDGGLYLKAGQVLDFEAAASLALVVTAASSAGTISKSVTLTIGDVDEAPTQLTIANLTSVAENTAVETRLADVSLSDPDIDPANRVYTFSVDDPRFEVRDGGLYLKAGQVLDFEAAASLALVVTAASSAGTISKSVTLTIGDVDEAPTQLTIANLTSVAENTAVETRLADVSLGDPDTDPANRVYTFSVDDPRFEVRDGGLYLKAGQVLDFEAAASLALVITAASSAGTISKSVTLTIGDVDEGAVAYLLNRSGTTTPLSVDLSQPVQTLADGTELSGVQRIHFLGGEGADTVLGGAFSDTLSGAGGADLLSGGGGDDVLIGAAGDTLLGGEGQDQFTISSAPAQIQGGAGMDVLTITGAAAFTAGSLSEVEQIFVNRGLKVDFSKLSVGQNVASGAGTAGGVYLIGSTGADTLVGGAGADTLQGGSGSDILQGGDGNDSLSGGPGNDSLYGGAGDDVLETKRSTGPDYFDGGDGIDRVVADFLTSSANMRLDLTHTDVLQALGGGSFMINVERVDLTTGLGDDILIGGALADTLNGGAGDDILGGARGNDRIAGGEGYDIAVFTGAFETYTILDQGGGQYRVSGPGQGDDILTGIETLRFSDGDHAIGGDSASAVYWGKTDGQATFTAATNVPDGRGATPGTGFTITGLTRAADGTWWAANEGQAEENDNTYTPSLVHLSADLQTKLGEINLGSPIRAVQGLAYRPGADQLLVASLSESKVRVYNASTGALVKIITPTTGTAPNGLAFDSLLDAAIISRSPGSVANTTVEWRSVATGALLKTLDVGVNPDHLFFDASQGAAGVLYITYGENGQAGLIDKRDVATGTLLGRFSVPQADAIEGIEVIGDQIYLANDAYFHHGSPPLNRILQFTADPVAWTYQRGASALNFTVDLAINDQTLNDGTRLVGVDRLFFQAGSGDDHLAGGRYNDVLVGGEGADILLGRAGSDRLVGGDGQDILGGGAGDDRVEGGAGEDTARFDGLRSAYSAIGLSSQSAQVSTLVGDEGSDLVSQVELFQFVDGTFTLAQLLRPEVTDVSLSNASLEETAVAGAVVGLLGASVQDAGPGPAITYSLGAEETRFALQGGQLVLAQALTPGVYHVLVQATDSRGAQRQEVFDITIIDVDQPPTQLTIANLTSVAENTAVETRLADVSLSDPDIDPANRVYTFSVDDPRFEVRDGGLYLKAGQVLDFEAAASLALVVTAASSAGTISKSVTLTIGDVDEAPTQLTIANLTSVAENTAVETRLADVSLSDPDIDPANRVYTFSVDDPRFEVRDGGLYLKAGQVLDFEAAASLALVVTAASSAGTISKSVTLTIGDVDEAPTQLTIANLTSVAENTAVETRLADVSLGDPDTDPANRVYTFSVDDPRFEVRDGGLYLKAGQVLDFEAAASLALVITAASSAGTISKSVTLTIGDVDEGAVAYLLNRSGTTTPLSVDLSQPVQTLADGTELSGVQRIHFLGGEGADTVLGGAFSDTLSGAGGADLLSGGGGDDVLIGAAGDTLLGGEGQDQFTISSAPAQIQGGAGMDVLTITGAAAFTAGSLSEVEQIFVNRGLKVDFSKLSVGQNVASGAGTAGGVYLIGSTGADTLVGGAGADTLEGGSGSDILQGGDGNDRLTGGPGNDSLYGGAGDDVLETKRSTGPDYFDGGDGIDRVVADFLASSANMRLDLTHTDVLQALGGGSFMINVERVDLTTGSGADVLIGGALADTLNGGAGDDILAGASGDDRLTGGAGRDVFQFSGAWGMDTITDFEKGQDQLDLHATGLSYEDLQFGTSSTSIIVHVAGFGDITLLNAVATGLSASDFLFT